MSRCWARKLYCIISLYGLTTIAWPFHYIFVLFSYSTDFYAGLNIYVCIFNLPKMKKFSVFSDFSMILCHKCVTDKHHDQSSSFKMLQCSLIIAVATKPSKDHSLLTCDNLFTSLSVHCPARSSQQQVETGSDEFHSGTCLQPREEILRISHIADH